MTKFYTFMQNNSGGSFICDAAGITGIVIIEARDENHAIERAENIGLYFNGVSDGLDCACCGDRWNTPWDEGTDEPMRYDKPVRGEKVDTAWMGSKPETAIHHIDGRIEWLDAEGKETIYSEKP